MTLRGVGFLVGGMEMCYNCGDGCQLDEYTTSHGTVHSGYG